MDSQSGLSAQLAELKSQLDHATEKASSVVEGLSAEQLRQRVQPDSWSVAECLVHLNITSKEYLPILNEALERARQNSSRTTRLKMDVMGRLLKWSLEPPARIKMKTTAQFEPVESQSTDEILPNFARLQEQLKTKIENANGLAIDKVKIVSPFNNRVKYNLFSAFNILAAHERRHLWQAEQVRKAIGA